MNENTINFVKLDAPNFEQVFEVSSTDHQISKVRAFEPELHGREIVLPVEFQKTNGETVLLGFTLDRVHLRDLFDAYEFDEVIER